MHMYILCDHVLYLYWCHDALVSHVQVTSSGF